MTYGEIKLLAIDVRLGNRALGKSTGFAGVKVLLHYSQLSLSVLSEERLPSRTTVLYRYA